MAHLSLPDQSPMTEINTTPLIDVLLVLLIMFVITIPIQSHSVKLDLPTGTTDIRIDSLRNTIGVGESGQAAWNGRPVSLAALSLHLAAVGEMRDQPDVQFQPDAQARYAIVDEVLAMTKRAEVKRLGFVGNERYAAF